MVEETWSIGQLARMAGCGVGTIRFYERKGLLPPPPRRASGYRVYNQAALRRLNFVHRAKQLGFSLAETRELLELRVMPGSTCHKVQERAHHKVLEIAAKIKELRRFDRALDLLMAQCDRGQTEGECPFLDALER